MKLRLVFFLLFVLFLLVSCENGVTNDNGTTSENGYYNDSDERIQLQQIPKSRVVMESSGRGVSISSLDFLATSIHAKNYTIFYRIYISSQEQTGIIHTTDPILMSINPALLSDFRAIYPFADPINIDINTTGIGRLFANRGYFELYVSDTGLVSDAIPIGVFLSRDFPGGISIHFPVIATVGAPFLIADGVVHSLIRAHEAGSSPIPINRLFLNHDDLNDNDNATEILNRDTVRYRYPNIQIPPRFTYVSMYIVTVGFDPVTFASIYSKPTHLGIFRLPCF